MKLIGQRVLITAPRQYANKLASILITAGARPIWMPTIRITDLPKNEIHSMDQVLENLCDFTHVAFTSKNGIASVMTRLQHLSQIQNQTMVDFIKSSHVKLCALGADAEELLKHGLSIDVQPSEASTSGLVKELKQINELRRSKILCPIPSVRGQSQFPELFTNVCNEILLCQGGLTEPIVVPRFLTMLREGGADVSPVAVYVTEPGCSTDDCLAEKQFLRDGHIRAIVFTSSAEAQGFVHAIGSLKEIQEIVKNSSILLAAHGPYTAAGVSHCLELNVPCVSQNFKTFDGIVVALEETLFEHQIETDAS